VKLNVGKVAPLVF